MSDLGPFAIKRIERGLSPDATIAAPAPAGTSVSTVLEQATEAAVARAGGKVERGSAGDADIATAIRARSASIDAETLTPLLGALSGPASLAPPARTHDSLAPASSSDPMRTSVFHPLSNLATPAASPSENSSAPVTGASDHAKDAGPTGLPSLLDPLLPARRSPPD